MVYRGITRDAKPKQDEYHANDVVVEAVVTEYTRRLQEYDKVIAELRMKLDLLEIRSVTTSQPSQPVHEEISQVHHAASQSSRPHAQRVSEPAQITQHAPQVVILDSNETKNGTMDYILKLLAERPRSSREVQQAIGRTREHTSRLMKKLNDTGLVTRSNDSKPFKYLITSLGQSRLREKAEGAEQPTRDTSTPYLDGS